MYLESNLQNIIRDWLKENDKTQKWLANEIDINESQLSRLLNSNTVQLDLRTATKIWKIIQFDPAELVKLKEGEIDE